MTVPEGDEIVYSTLCKGNIIYGNKTYNWVSHILISNNGIAHVYPDVYTKGNPIFSDYTLWDDVDSIIKITRRTIINVKGFTYEFFRFKEVESPEDFKKRKKEFVARFRPILIEKKEKWLEKNQNTNDKSIKRKIKLTNKGLAKLKKYELKRLSNKQ